MNNSTIRLVYSFIVFSSIAMFVGKTDAATISSSPTFSVIDLGDNFTFTKDSDGYTTSVTNAAGNQTYAFAKYPVNYTNIQISPGDGDEGDNGPSIEVASNKYGNLFYTNVTIPGFHISQYNLIHEQWTTISPGDSPAKDFNISGQVVGSSYNLAVFSLPNFTGHGTDFGGVALPGGDVLNNYISSQLGINLTSGLYIDDLGDIIAQGTLNGQTQDFLLTLNGSPTPAPEPSTLVLMAVVISALGIRSIRRNKLRADS
jgi:hypothetical protein